MPFKLGLAQNSKSSTLLEITINKNVTKLIDQVKNNRYYLIRRVSPAQKQFKVTISSLLASLFNESGSEVFHTVALV